MTKSIIAALGREREIGVGDVIPWNLPEDRRRFRELTTGYTVVMGRKTYDSIIQTLHKPLPNRTNIVVTKDLDFEAPGCVVVHSIEEAMAATDPDEEVFIIGGATIYEQTLPVVDKLYLTEVNETYPEADKFFPEVNLDEWQVVQTIPMPKSQPSSPDFCFVVYERKK